MLDIKYIRENTGEVIKALSIRNGDFSYLKELVKDDESRRKIIVEVEELKTKRNKTSKLIGQYKKDGKDVKDVLDSVASIGDTIKNLDEKLKVLNDKIHKTLLYTPNIPKSDTPIGIDDSENVEIKKVGKIIEMNFNPKPHWDVATALDIIDFDRATKITGTRFAVYKGLGARLERSLISFMMDLHSQEHGYTEIIPPFIVNRESMIATGQFPKFEEDSFKLDLEDKDYFLNPTAEVPTVNLHRGETLDGNLLPIKYCSFTTAFRSEAGSAGRDTRGLIRQHQFNKIELIKLTKPEDSYKELELMLNDSTKVLDLLKIPYRIVRLCSGDLPFALTMTYDIEVWLPSYNTYREIGSISNAEDYQARRGNIKFKRTKDSKPEYLHTLNGSGLAVGRTVVAILENYQQADGSILVPKVLIPYMKVDIIK